MICHRLCSYWSSWQPPTPCMAVIPSTMRQHLYCMDLYNSLWGCATFGLHNILQQLLLCYLLDGSIYLVPSTSSFCMQTRECQLFLQVKSSFEDRVIASILGKSSDVAFRISVSEPSFYSLYFAVTLHDSKISFVLCQLSAIIWLPIEKVLWKFPEDRWKFVEDSFRT